MFKNKLNRYKKKRVFLALMLLSMMLSFAGCEKKEEGTTEELEAVIEDLTSMAEGVMTYEQVQAAQEGAAVVIDVSVKEKSEWKDYKAVIMVQDQDGIYRIEELTCSEALYDNLSNGTKIRITGYKGEASDQPVITNASLEELD